MIADPRPLSRAERDALRDEHAPGSIISGGMVCQSCAGWPPNPCPVIRLLDWTERLEAAIWEWRDAGLAFGAAALADIIPGLAGEEHTRGYYDAYNRRVESGIQLNRLAALIGSSADHDHD